MKRTYRHRYIIAAICLLIFACAVGSYARRQRTTRQGLKERIEYTAGRTDTLELTSDTLVTFSGYDKTLRSRSESILALNNSTDTIVSLTIEITYKDMQGRQIHRRRVTSRQVIPPSERRMLTFASWDKQNSYYYFRSEPGRVRYQSVMPYQVDIRPIRALIPRHTSQKQ